MSTITYKKKSVDAARALLEMAEDDPGEAYEMMGNTDCPDGCFVEPDGVCSHGYESAGRTAGMI